jgi:type III restriction enzyme
MRASLFPFQETALANLHDSIRDAHAVWSEKKPQVISFTAPTGAGKTIIMTALFEDIIFGYANGISEPDSVFVWLSDMPELNEQSRLKIENVSEKFRTRDIRVIDSYFDAKYFPSGGIYFLNTQKLGTDKLLTQKSDLRQYTIWETLANTAARQPKSFYVVIDEAHRGTNISAQAENKAQSIMQKFIKGSKEDGLPVIPLVIGVTATPQRFQKLIADTTSTIHKVVVPPEEVIESGLLKDRIIIHFPELAIDANMTMFKEAVINWKKKCELWTAYCEKEETKNVVRPILVVQVEDGNDHEITKTDISSCISTLEELLGRKLQVGEVVHTFNDKETINFNNLDIHRIDASYIEEDKNAIVVFFKMNLSTGWDCPRAETMMSFRHANDYTYIAQLLGRMIRTPLARRVESEAELNNVALYLPYFDEKTVKSVEEALRNSEAIVPSETGSHKNLVTLKRSPDFTDIFDNMELKTYRIDSARKQPALRRLMALARALTHDMIAPNELKITLQKILDTFEKEILTLKKSGKFDELLKSFKDFALKTLTIEYSGDLASTTGTDNTVELSEHDLDILFKRAGDILSNGLHMEYWKHHSERDHEEVKTEVITLTNDNESMKRIEIFADEQFNTLYDEYRSSFKKLKENRKDIYKKLAQSSPIPIAIDWELPQTIDFNLGNDPKMYEKHLYIPSKDKFKATLNNWESDLLKEELSNGAIAWLRNLDRKIWSLEIPYESSGIITPMYPDLIIVRTNKKGYIFDVLELHDSSRNDNVPKTIGLAKFAEKHSDDFGRIQLIRKKKGADNKEHFYRLDMCKLNIRNKVRSVSSDTELDKIFDTDAITED